jgi:hypothetical protein
MAQERVVTSGISIEQDQLAAGAYTTNRVLLAGRQFFAVPYLPADGHGEGITGPRAAQRQMFYADSLQPAYYTLPFLRVNGIDSQNCFACHNSAGTSASEGSRGRTQKRGGVGGSADFASVLYANPEPFDERLTYIVRVPPKSFGTGYLQELALEMTATLQKIEADATSHAAQFPGNPVTANLVAKGVSFGQITITCPNATCSSPTRDTSHVEGVSPDLIVRPLQHKGVASTLRSFAKSALDFHFSMQPVEVVGMNTDCDRDGLINEMAVDVVNPALSSSSLQVQQSLGNVAALAAFAGMLRPPVNNNQIDSVQVANGKEIFAAIGCTNCHVSNLTTRPNPKFRIELAEPAPGCPTSPAGPQLGSFAEVRSSQHPALLAIDAEQKVTQSGSLSTACPSGFYCIDLTNPGTVGDEFLPRLPANSNGTVTVPLYSDLKRHDMGPFLAQVDPPQADDAGNEIPNREWLTTKLWGVADNGPWLHDGRARTLNEAILMHDGPNGNGPHGEAQAEVDAYQALPASDQDALIAFLESLQVPPTP